MGILDTTRVYLHRMLVYLCKHVRIHGIGDRVD